ncbi:MAG TPA: flagellar protein [bacterium]|nr:flagellar protein [bacterium]
MRKLCGLIGIALLFTGAFVFAEKKVLIDFSELTADVALGDAQEPNEHGATLVDFSSAAGSSWDAETKAKMKTSLAIGNWSVELASSSRSVANQSNSLTKAVVTRDTARQFPSETVMGIRVHFPLASYNSYAVIKPPFEIPAYAIKTEFDGTNVNDVEGDLGTKFDLKGVVKNVGVLKSVSVTVYGSNFPNGFGLILKDQNGREQTIFLEYLAFDGWRNLEWKNPNYITDVRNREMRRFPLYPKSEPFVKLVGFVIYRDAAQEGGDIVTYIKDVSITYDKAILDTARDINDEQFWKILSDRQKDRKEAELRRLGNKQVLRILEKEKMHKAELAEE